MVPGSAHTYDGLQFSRVTRTLFFAMSWPADGSCFGDAKGQFANDPRVISRGAGEAIFEFNPSRTETRHNLKPLTWRRVTELNQISLSFPRTLELPDGSMIVGSSTQLWAFDPVTGKVGGRLSSEPVRESRRVHHGEERAHQSRA